MKLGKYYPDEQFKLCYVEDNVVYFTSKISLEDQWGDDWGDAHNAEPPYLPSRPDLDNRFELFPTDWNEDGTPKWEIIKLCYMCDDFSPIFKKGNYSVETINKGEVPWLYVPYQRTHPIEIFAGCSIDEFIETIYKLNGEVFIPLR